MLTLGSLFDGIGGFPLAGIHNGITPLWASEIEPFPIKVTQIRFPDMIHVGDITKLDGSRLPPVDVICGGSPCQDLSVAGQRRGLAGERSGLFMDQVRIVKEMRNADAGRGIPDHLSRPRYLVWENVPGAFSSANGEDFRAVIEEIVRIKDDTCHVPRPDSGRWEPAGAAILGTEFSLAWRVLDAQYWGVAQRRRRIFLVADFGGLTAPQILFKQESLFGDSAEGKGQREGVAGAAERGADVAGGACMISPELQRTEQKGKQQLLCLNNQGGSPMDVTEDMTATFQAGMGNHPPLVSGQAVQAAGVVTKGNGECFLMTETHAALTEGGGQAGQGYPCVLTAGFCGNASSEARGIGLQTECSPTIKTGQAPSVLCLNDQGGSQMDTSEDVSGTLRAQEHGHQPLIMATQQGGAEIGEGICPTITGAAGSSGNNQPVLFENHGIDARYTGPHGVAPTMSARYGTGGNNVPLVADQPESYCIAGNIIDRQDKNGGNGLGCQPDISYTLTGMDRHAVFSRQRSDELIENEVVATQSARQHKDATDLIMEVFGVDCRNGNENGDISGTLQPGSGGTSLNSIHPVRMGKRIRRLTPLECERLQGFPDGWTDIPGASDSARYKALGNSVAIPCVDFVLRGIAYFLRKIREET